jgi:hypothetical protein
MMLNFDRPMPNAETTATASECVFENALAPCAGCGDRTTASGDVRSNVRCDFAWTVLGHTKLVTSHSFGFEKKIASPKPAAVLGAGFSSLPKILPVKLPQSSAKFALKINRKVSQRCHFSPPKWAIG